MIHYSKIKFTTCSCTKPIFSYSSLDINSSDCTRHYCTITHRLYLNCINFTKFI
nr:MAG TPA: hypothetical protein [Caudoviricetes sp.]